MIKAQYSGGALSVKDYDDRQSAFGAMKWLRTHASIDWAKLYEVTVTEEWDEIDYEPKEAHA